MGVSIVLITWNRKDELRRTLAHIFRYPQYFDEVLLVDNGSSDGTPAMVEQEFRRVRLIRMHKNTGVCEARNIGAINARNELLLFLDDDGYFDMSAVPVLVKQFEANERLAVLGCRVLHVKADQLAEPDFGALRPPTAEALPGYTFFGGAFMARRSALIEAGMFPDHFFYSNEENDLSLRLIRMGYEIRRCTGAIMLHYASPKQRPSSRHTYYYYRNIHFEIWRNLPAIFALKESLAVSVGGLVRTIVGGNLSAFCRGTLAALIRLPGVIARERRPLTFEQYRYYAKLRGPDFRVFRRVRKLVGAALSVVSQSRREDLESSSN